MDRENVVKEYEDFVKSFSKRDDTYYKSLFNSVLALLKEQEAVVHCRDCKHSERWYGDKRRCFLWHETGIDVFDDGFCNYGERQEGR